MTNDCTTVMVATYNRLPLTQRAFGGLKASIDRAYRLVVVDNGSTDGTVEWLRELRHEDFPHCVSIDLQFNEKNLGIGTARNQGLKLADLREDPYLCTLDNDVEMPVGWLGECIDFLKANPQFAIGVNMEKKPYPLKTFNGKTIQYKDRGNLGTACMVFGRGLHNAIGYFNTEYSKYGEEDADWGMRSRMVHFEMGYLRRDGEHFGDGELDVGEYRAFKDECRKQNLEKFYANCRGYYNGSKPLYIPYSERTADE